MELVGLRERAVLDRWLPLVAAGFVALAIAGGFVTYATHLEPGTHTEQRTVHEWETTGSFDHWAVVTEPNPVFPVGTELRNRTAYVAAGAPVLNGTFAYSYATPGDGNLTVATDLRMVLREVDGDRQSEGETVLWRTTRNLSSDRAQGVEPSERVEVPFSVNASAARDRAQNITSELGTNGGETEAFVSATVAVEGTVDGREVRRTNQYELPLTLGPVYRVGDAGPTSDSHATTRTVRVENAYGPVRKAAGPLLLVVGLFGAGAVVAARRRGAIELSPAEREYLDYRADRAEFDEWINAISLPEQRAATRAEADSLGDLVDFAIDTDNSVVEDPEEGTYHVVHEGIEYVYEPPARANVYGSEGGYDSTTGSQDADERDEESRSDVESGEDPLAPSTDD